MKKNILSVLIAMSLTVAMLAGCGDGNSNSVTTSAGKTVSTVTTDDLSAAGHDVITAESLLSGDYDVSLFDYTLDGQSYNIINDYYMNYNRYDYTSFSWNGITEKSGISEVKEAVTELLGDYSYSDNDYTSWGLFSEDDTHCVELYFYIYVEHNEEENKDYWSLEAIYSLILYGPVDEYEEPSVTEEPAETETQVSDARLPINTDITIAVAFNRFDTNADGQAVAVFDVGFTDNTFEEIMVEKTLDDSEYKEVFLLEGQYIGSGMFRAKTYMSHYLDTYVTGYQIWSLGQPEVAIDRSEIYDCYYGTETSDYAWLFGLDTSLPLSNVEHYLFFKAPDGKYVYWMPGDDNGNNFGLVVKKDDNYDTYQYTDAVCEHLSKLNIGSASSSSVVSFRDYWTVLGTPELMSELNKTGESYSETVITNYYGTPCPFGTASALSESDSEFLWTYQENFTRTIADTKAPSREFALPTQQYSNTLFGQIIMYYEDTTGYRWTEDQENYPIYVDGDGTVWYLIFGSDSYPTGWTSHPDTTDTDIFGIYNEKY